MGSGPGPAADWNIPADIECMSLPGDVTPPDCFTENRSNLHLHGGRTPWISDGTPHQWIIPASDTNPLTEGASVENVPDMWFNSAAPLPDGSYPVIAGASITPPGAYPGATNDPGPGAQTYYYTNQQSARLLFYHDHAWGITRLNVYAGMAAGYLITDDKEEDLIDRNVLPDNATLGAAYRYGIPLVIQDKTFVDATGTTGTNSKHILNTDPTWAWGSNPAKPATTNPVTGDLWWPHVYMPAQNPYNPDFSGVNPMGRWVYGPWFWPPTNNIDYGPVPNAYIAEPGQPPEMPGTPNPSWGAEAFMDTPIVNGAAYPTVTLQPGEYRFRILNAAHDRFFNLQLYKATGIVNTFAVTNPGSNYTSAPTVTITGDGTGATATATVDLTPLSATLGQVTGITINTVGSGYTVAPTVTITGGGGSGATATATVYTAATEVGMVPAIMNSGFPELWPNDGREGGVPHPDTRGPAMIQIGNEGGFLPKPVLLNNQPINWVLDPTLFTAGLVAQQNEGGGTLQIGPAERADVIIDFTNYAGQTLILYNDAPAPWPALDPHYDYYTRAPDRRAEMGGADSTVPGKGPNTRTLMRIVVAQPAGAGSAPADDYNATTLTTLETEFAGATGVFATSQDSIIAGQTAYNSAYGTTFPASYPNWGISNIWSTSLNVSGVTGEIKTINMKPKAIQDEMGEVFDEYGRMSAKLGLELPATTALNQTFVVQNFVDPATEIVYPGETQIWKITHNGVDTHPVHFHLFDVQVLNRVGWDGFITLPDDNELGWKETVRISPLQDTIVALRPIIPQVPFPVPTSVRPLNPAMPLDATMGFTNLDPLTAEVLNPPTSNVLANFGHEYVWHCHILSHEESDMMRPIIFNIDQLVYTVDATNGVRKWELGNWTTINGAVPASMVASGTRMYANVAGSGLYQWNGSAWTRINTAIPTSMVAADLLLFADYGATGLWKWNGTTWTKINTAIPTKMVASGSVLYADYGATGLWKYTAGVWTKINASDPTNIWVSGSILYVGFSNGLWKLEGGTWSRINSAVPTNMLASGSVLYADYGASGLWTWNGSAWSKINTTVPASMVASGSGTALFANYGASGLWRWESGTWTKINVPVPTSMSASGAVLYADYGASGLWKWEAGTWSKLTTTDPAIMVAGF
jgi:FtsP/CotA-like multicopper oxidase with cupredoxin domain